VAVRPGEGAFDSNATPRDPNSDPSPRERGEGANSTLAPCGGEGGRRPGEGA
jgi:hypothetical protein